MSPKLKIIEGSAPQSEFEITKHEHLIGRVAPADILIPASGVSGRHARLFLRGTDLLIEDLGSTNGTYVNGKRVAGPVILNQGDEIGLGQSVRLSLDWPRAAEGPAAGMSTELEPGSATMLEPEPAPPPQPAPPTPRAAPSAPPPEDPKATVVGEMDASAAPPQLQVSIAGSAGRMYPLNRVQVTIGREPGNDIIIDSKIVSRKHARIERTPDGGYKLIVLSTSNPTFLDGAPVGESARLKHGTKIRIGSTDPGLMVSMTYLAPSEALTTEQKIAFGEKTTLTIGRDAANDIVLDVPQVSRFHAQLERVGRRYRVRDLRSTNGTFVNGETVEGDSWLQTDDRVRIGSYTFLVGEDELAQIDESGGLEVEAVGLNKWVTKNLNILQNISLNFEPREFVVVVGQSGGGKSTLVDCIAGYRPASHGRVFVNGIDVYENFDAIRSDLGYVPQKDIIHKELTVFQSLDYSAQLRMPPDTTKEERHKRVMETLEDLDIAHRKDTQISQLSGGQQKRVSIGVELLTRPGLFFLDEPSSGLDPGTETALMQLMRRLADQGRTIVLITHATKNVVLADKVVFLARGGHLVWFGAPEEALEFFNQFRSEREQRAGPMEFDEIYAILDDPSKGTAEQWAERYQQHRAYREYIVEPLADRVSELSQKNGRPSSRPAVAADPKARKQVSALRQFFILSGRNLKILTRDRFSLFLMLAAAPIVGLLDILLANLMGSNPFAWGEGGNANNVIITLFLLTIYGVMVGGIAQMREIVKEADIYKRERLVNLKIVPYILSKVWVAGILALYQALWYVVIHYLAFDMPGGASEFVLIYISMALATMAGMMLGLFASAISPTANAAPLIVIMLMLPQIVLGGALVPVPSFISAPTSTRWAFEAFIGITGIGSDIAKDSCYLLTPEELGELGYEGKTANCNCLGANILDQDSCDFPSLGLFAAEQVEVGSEPVEPVPPEGLGSPPPEPDVPEPPVAPADQSDTVAMAEYFTALQEYQTLVEGIQDDYRAQVAVYEAEAAVFQAEADIYAADFEAYLQDLAAYRTRQAVNQGIVQTAESQLLLLTENFGWAWVDKDDPGAYYGKLAGTWIAQGTIMGVLLVGILFFQKRKDN